VRAVGGRVGGERSLVLFSAIFLTFLCSILFFF